MLHNAVSLMSVSVGVMQWLTIKDLHVSRQTDIFIISDI